MGILGIDIGGSGVRAVLLNGKKIKCLFSKDTSFSLEEIKKVITKYKGVPTAATGGGAKKIKKSLGGSFSKKINIIDEIAAIGIGGVFLAEKKKTLVVSVGTGTPMVAVKNGRIEHIGGTGLGGGTLKGFSQLLFKEENLDELERIAKKGKREKIDLKVRDIMGGAVGIVPADATASNFGKIAFYRAKGKSCRGASEKSDISQSLFNMVAEVVGTLAFFGAKNYGLEKDIVFCGRVAENKIIKKRLIETVKLWGGRALVLEKARYACAIGAAKSLVSC